MARRKDLPSPARIRAFFAYNKRTGALTWKRDKGAVKAGANAGCDDGKGYLHVGFDGDNYKVQVLAFVIVTGRWPRPGYMVDHKDTNRLNNRWINLREITRSQNGKNRGRANRNNLTGIRGVYPTPDGKFRAFITISAGTHATAAAAARAIARLRQIHHGQFAGASNVR